MAALKLLNMLAQWLVLVGGLNWGLIGFFKVDAVEVLLPKGLAGLTYKAVGLAALFMTALRLYAMIQPTIMRSV